MLIWHVVIVVELKMLERTCRFPSFETCTLVVVLFCTVVDEHPASLWQISLCVPRELCLYDWINEGFAWSVSSESK